jgi:poly(3-hydroxybutyrate) depolymerase/membrane protease YdiL (CAAX protease family)
MPQAPDVEYPEHAAHPLRFLGWVLLLSIPFYVWGIFWPIQVLPFGLPIAATMIVVPALLATVMTLREQGRRAAIELWLRIFDAGRAKGGWALFAFLFWPVVMLISYGFMRWLGLSLPADVTVAILQAPVLFAAFFLGAILEEIGWTGYATGPLQERYGIIRAGLIIGTVWAAWHIVPNWQLHPNQAIWVASQALGVVITRIVMGWIYAYGGRSLFLAIAFHAMDNVAWKLFPNEGSHYDPSVTTPVLVVLAALMAVSPLISRRRVLLKTVAITIAAASLVWMLLASRGEDGDIVITTNDGPRTALILPAGQGPHPTVIVLHGAAVTAEITARHTGFAEAAASAGFTAVFPQGLRRRWHDERSGGFDGPDDVAFLRALTTRLIEERVALAGHIYITGISNGGIMSFTMACKAGDLFRGIATIVANMPEGLEPCNPPPMPLVMISGTADSFAPYDGGKVGWLSGGGALWSVKQSLEFFVHRNGCTASSERQLSRSDNSDAPRTTEIAWRDCSSGKPVILYRIDGGGHQVPGRPAFLSFIFGRSTSDISAADSIMSAFAREDASAAKM